MTWRRTLNEVVDLFHSVAAAPFVRALMPSILTIAIVVGLWVGCAAGAGFAPKTDPWYGIPPTPLSLDVPDKFAHFYGSMAIDQVVGPELTIAGRFVFELIDYERGVGFSWRDLVADGLGALAGELYGSRLQIVLVWDSLAEDLVAVIVWRW